MGERGVRCRKPSRLNVSARSARNHLRPTFRNGIASWGTFLSAVKLPSSMAICRHRAKERAREALQFRRARAKEEKAEGRTEGKIEGKVGGKTKKKDQASGVARIAHGAT